MTRRCKVLGLLSLALVVLLAPTRAWGFWVVGSSGATGLSAANTIAAPTLSVTDDTTTSVTLGVTAPTSGLAATSYQINRTAPLPVVNDVCSVSGTSGTCTDATAVGGTTYTYQAVGSYGSSWTATAANSPTVSQLVPASDTFTVAATKAETAGVAFNVTVTAMNGTKVDKTYVGPQSLTWSGAANSPDGTAPTFPANPVSFTKGVATSSVTLVQAKNNVKLTVTDANNTAITGTSSGINVSAAAAANLALTGVTGAGTVATGCYYTCTVTGAGSTNNVKASITLTDSFGNPVNASALISVTLTATMGTPTSLTSPVTIASGSATSGQFTLKTQSGTGWTSEAVTASASPYANAVLTVNRS